MSTDFLDTRVEYLKGVGPQKAEILQKELGVFFYKDLIDYLPSKYIDKSFITKIGNYDDNSPNIQIRAKIIDIQLIGTGKSQRLSVIVADESGALELVWFKNFQNILKNLALNSIYTIYGRVSEFKGKLSISHPEIKLFNSQEPVGLKLEPVYPLTEQLKNRYIDSKFINGLILQILNHPKFQIPEFIPESVIQTAQLINPKLAYQWIHSPQNDQELNAAEKRIKFEEMFILAMRAEKNKVMRRLLQKGIAMPRVGDFFKDFYNQYLNFELTDAQKRVIKEIKNDMASGCQMNRLLQGDVGSGKTIVALLCMILAIDNQHQTCLMAPTEILATQHFITISDLLKEMPIKVAILTGSTKTKERRELLESLKDGSVHILIGTHALIEDDVVFKSLGLAIIDEQHRFGVAQRAKIWKKNQNPHVLVMTATPIPRTLAMTVHGELDFSIIDELPKNRKPIKTIHRDESFRDDVMAFVKREIEKGRQIYIVYPLIEESKKLELNDLMNGYDIVTSYFPVPEYQISILHGRMKYDVKEFEMNRFKDGYTNIMVSTTVIEVGVNVPNASVMIIENANRFGLSQLHQLRGRVGRGSEQSFCILMTKDELNFPSKKRMNTMCKSNDGFVISQVDLELRGPGDVLGTRQSGLPDFKLLDLAKDFAIIDLAKRAAAFLLNNDPELIKPENNILLNYLKKHQKDHFWSKIS